MTTVPQILSSFLGSQEGCSVSKVICVPLLGGLPRLTLSCDQLHRLWLSQKKFCFPPAKCYESAASPPFIHPQQNWSYVWPRYNASGTHRSPSIFSYLHESSLFPGQARCICSSSRCRSSQAAASVSRHSPAAPSSLPSYRAPTLAVRLAPPPQPPKAASQRQGLESGDPSSSLSVWLSISVQGNDFYPSHCFLFPAWFL